MPSTLTRLFRYAKSGKAEALENFTTEALAAGVRADPAPFVAVLRRSGLLRYDQEPAEVDVQTQVAVQGAGILDLTLALSGPGFEADLWIEVKVGAGESGHQLAAYRKAASGMVHRPRLIVLSKLPLPGQGDIPWVGWQIVKDEARRHGGSVPAWTDLAQFLEEIHMADPFDAPIVAGEAASLLPAQTLYLKVARIVAQVLEEGKERWPALGWPKSTNDVDEQMLWQFRNHGRFTVPVRVWGPVRLFFGVAQQDSSADFHEPEPHLCVWLEHAPRQVDLRRRLLDAADTGSLGSNWSRRLPGWWALTAHVRLGAFGDHAEAGDWILTRIGELSDAGLFAPLDVGAVMTSEPDEEPAQ